MLTIFKQFHPQNERLYLNQLCHYFKNEVFLQNAKAGGSPLTDLTRNASMTLVYLDEIVRFKGNTSRETIN